MDSVYAQMHMHLKIWSEISLVSYAWSFPASKNLETPPE